MGFRDLQSFNLAILAKHGWWMLEEPSSLMARLYKTKYFLNCDVLSANLGSNPFYAWRSIHKSFKVLKQGTRWQVGNREMIHTWDEKWLPTPKTYKVISPQKDFGDFPMVSALIDVDTRRWRKNRLDSIFLPFEVETILNIPISHHLPEDSIIWMGNKKGKSLQLEEDRHKLISTGKKCLLILWFLVKINAAKYYHQTCNWSIWKQSYISQRWGSLTSWGESMLGRL